MEKISGQDISVCCRLRIKISGQLRVDYCEVHYAVCKEDNEPGRSAQFGQELQEVIGYSNYSDHAGNMSTGSSTTGVLLTWNSQKQTYLAPSEAARDQNKITFSNSSPHLLPSNLRHSSK